MSEPAGEILQIVAAEVETGLDHPKGAGYGELVPFGAEVAARSQHLAQLQRDREVHAHKTIWTKDAHDGPYRKVPTPFLLETPDMTVRMV